LNFIKTSKNEMPRLKAATEATTAIYIVSEALNA
tara:strand:+ start:289 stop:390 length:102 start_codon:yes stop_codon:yes gene_type:complete